MKSFQTVRPNSLKKHLPFFSFFLNTLTLIHLFRQSLFLLFIFLLVVRDFTLYMVFFPRLSFRKFFYPNRFPAPSFYQALQGISGLLWLLKSSWCSSHDSFQTGFRALHWTDVSTDSRLHRAHLSGDWCLSCSDTYFWYIVNFHWFVQLNI